LGGNNEKRLCKPNNDTISTEKMSRREKEQVLVDVIIPVHDASETIKETVESALSQIIPEHLRDALAPYQVDVAVCCHDDASKDNSLAILQQLQQELRKQKSHLHTSNKSQNKLCNSPHFFIGKSENEISRGAGYARNQAVALRTKSNSLSSQTFHFLCLLDSDDIMKPNRIAEQLFYFISIPKQEDRDRILLGTTFVRDPPDSTWHYSSWANQLTDERLFLEKFREVTILQPTWMMTKSRFQMLGGYIEAPLSATLSDTDANISTKHNQPYKLIHPIHDTPQTLRLAEDLRLFHAHLSFTSQIEISSSNSSDDQAHSNNYMIQSEEYKGGLVRLLRTSNPLLVYRHRKGMSQSASTPRKLLLQLRAKAFEDTIIIPRSNPDLGNKNKLKQISWEKFAIWGAGRDGKDFFKALSPETRKRVICFVDVDWRKIENTKFYVNNEINAKVPILHFSDLAVDHHVRKKWEKERHVSKSTSGKKHGGSHIFPFGNITKEKSDINLFTPKTTSKESKSYNGASTSIETTSLKTSGNNDALSVDEKVIDLISLSIVPVVVCVAMYRTNGVLEANVESIGRQEGRNLWHFS